MLFICWEHKYIYKCVSYFHIEYVLQMYVYIYILSSIPYSVVQCLVKQGVFLSSFKYILCCDHFNCLSCSGSILHSHFQKHECKSYQVSSINFRTHISTPTLYPAKNFHLSFPLCPSAKDQSSHRFNLISPFLLAVWHWYISSYFS